MVALAGAAPLAVAAWAIAGGAARLKTGPAGAAAVAVVGNGGLVFGVVAVIPPSVAPLLRAEIRTYLGEY